MTFGSSHPFVRSASDLAVGSKEEPDAITCSPESDCVFERFGCNVVTLEPGGAIFASSASTSEVRRSPFDWVCCLHYLVLLAVPN